MRRQYVVVSALIGGLALLIVWALFTMQADHDKWVAWCGEQGGHVISDSDVHTGVGYAPNYSTGGGSVVVTTSSSTDYYCLSETGGIVDIR